MANDSDQKRENRYKKLAAFGKQVAEFDELGNEAYPVSESNPTTSSVLPPTSEKHKEGAAPDNSASQLLMTKPFDNFSNARGIIQPQPLPPVSNEPPKSIFSNPAWPARQENAATPPQKEPLTRPHPIKPAQDYRQRRVDRVSKLLQDRYRRITNEANSPLLVDAYTGDVLPDRLDAISSAVAADYRRHHQAEVPNADIKRAFSHLSALVAPWEATVFFGRAGYNPHHRERYIDAGPGRCFVFTPGASYYQPLVGQPCIRPLQSRPLDIPAEMGNVNPHLIDPLFALTVLPQDSNLLVIAWMILCWMPDRKQVMLELLGTPSISLEQSHTLIKNVVDPSTVALQNELPNHVKQFNNLALKHYLLSFNQVDALTPTQQNHLSTLMRGKQIPWQWQGKTVDASITVQCPVILNSLESVVTTPKLADATLSVEIKENDQSKGLPAMMPSAASLTMGLLMIFGQVHSEWETVSYDPRFERYGDLADLCRVGELVAVSLGRGRSMFWEQFDRNQQGRRGFELEETPVAQAVAHALDDVPGGVIELPVKQWLAHLKPYRPDVTRPEQWPTSSRGLGAAFKRIKPLLRDVGITLTSTGQRGPFCYWRAEKTTSHSAE